MTRIMIAPVSILIIAAGAATLNFTFAVTSASITTSGTAVSVSGPATLTVSGVGTDTGTFSATGSLANISGGNVTVPYTDTFGHGTLTGSMTFPAGVLVGSAPVSGSATITSATGLYASLANTTVTGSGFSGGALSGGKLSFSISGTANGRQYTFIVTNASVTISGTSMFSGAASLTLGGNSPDTGTFSATGSLDNASGGNLTVPFTVTLGHGTITGNMSFPEAVLVNPGPVSGSATITGGTGSYSGYTSSTLTASGTVTGSVLSGGTLSFSISGAVNTGGSSPGTNITYNVNVNITSSNPTNNPKQSDSVVGTITTDGTIGTILAHNIKSWDLKLIDLLNSANNIELTPANSQVVEDGDGAGQHIGGGGLTATATGLFFDFSNKSAQMGFQATATYSGNSYFCLSGVLDTSVCATGESIAPNNFFTDGVVATPAPTGNQPLNAPSVAISEVDNGFSNVPNSPIQSGSWVVVKGTNLSANPGRGWNADESFPTSMDGTSVTINNKPAFLYYISPGQLNLQAPTDSTVGPVTVAVTNNGVTGTATRGSDYIGNPAVISVTVSAKAGDILTRWATGLGDTTPPLPAGQQPTTFPSVNTPPMVTVGGLNAAVLSAVLRYAGLYQVNIQLPASLPAGDLPIKLIQGSYQSPDGVLINIAP